MSDDKHSTSETCHHCGDDASLSAVGSDNVFRPVCIKCFEEHHDNSRSPPDWMDGVFLSTAAVAAFAADLLFLSTVSAIGILSLILTGWLTLTTASGTYPWSLPPMGGLR